MVITSNTAYKHKQKHLHMHLNLRQVYFTTLTYQHRLQARVDRFLSDIPRHEAVTFVLGRIKNSLYNQYGTALDQEWRSRNLVTRKLVEDLKQVEPYLAFIVNYRSSLIQKDPLEGITSYCPWTDFFLVFMEMDEYHQIEDVLPKFLLPIQDCLGVEELEINQLVNPKEVVNSFLDCINKSQDPVTLEFQRIFTKNALKPYLVTAPETSISKLCIDFSHDLCDLGVCTKFICDFDTCFTIKK